jgi:hypothetical protein
VVKMGGTAVDLGWWWPEVHGSVMLGAQTIGVWGEKSMRENVGARGTIYRGRAGHRRGARGKQRSPSMAAFNSRVTRALEGWRHLLEGKWRGG